jgi:hypothetical protein
LLRVVLDTFRREPRSMVQRFLKCTFLDCEWGHCVRRVVGKDHWSGPCIADRLIRFARRKPNTFFPAHKKTRF